MRRIIAIDFDNCLFQTDYPEIGLPNRKAITAAREAQQNGAILILWTCRKGKHLRAALNACRREGLRFDYINQNADEAKAEFGGDCRKVYADEYWDDKAVSIRA